MPGLVPGIQMITRHLSLWITGSKTGDDRAVVSVHFQWMQKQYFAYIMASRRNGTLYVGVTGDLARRVWEHKEGVYKGFTKKYSVQSLAWFETFDDIRDAIQREKNIKKWPRQWKLNLIESINPEWRDLYEDLG